MKRKNKLLAIVLALAVAAGLAFTATGCGKGKNKHKEHAFGEAWAYNATQHWRECECGEKDGTAGHTFDGGVITTEPTFEAEGVKTFTCTVCGHKITESAAKPQHSFAAGWSHDADGHWHACTDPGYGHLKTGEAPHTIPSWTVTLAATHAAEGSRKGSCSVCGREITEVLHKLPHIWAEAWSRDGTHHWHECEIDGCADTDGYGEHDFDEQTSPATYEAAGKNEFTCKVCDYYYFETIDRLEKTVTGITDIQSLSKSYDGEAVSAPSYTTEADGTATVTYHERGNPSPLASAPKDAGEYTVKIVIAESGTMKGCENSAGFTITQREATLIWAGHTGLTYDGNPASVTASAGNLVSGDTCGVTVTGGAQTNAGDYTATATALTGAASGNYKLPASVTLDYTIYRAAPGITAWPSAGGIYDGQPLSASALTGGEAGAAGTFAWKSPSLEPSSTGSQAVAFTPDDPDNYEGAEAGVPVTVTRLKITAEAGENGGVRVNGNSVNGDYNVLYGRDYTVTFHPDYEYTADGITVDGSPLEGEALTSAISGGYRFNGVTDNHTLQATFKEAVDYYNLSLAVTGGAFGTVEIDRVTTAPFAPTPYAYGDHQLYVARVSSDYYIKSLKIGGVEYSEGEYSRDGISRSFTLSSDTEITVEFAVKTFEARAYLDDYDYSYPSTDKITIAASQTVSIREDAVFGFTLETGYTVRSISTNNGGIGKTYDAGEIAAALAAGSITIEGVTSTAYTSIYVAPVYTEIGLKVSAADTDAEYSMNSSWLPAQSNGFYTSYRNNFYIFLQPGRRAHIYKDGGADDLFESLVTGYDETASANYYFHLPFGVSDTEYTVIFYTEYVYVTFDAPSNGIITAGAYSYEPVSPPYKAVKYSSFSLYFAADAGYEITGLKINGADAEWDVYVNPRYTFENLAGGVTLAVTFTAVTYTLTLWGYSAEYFDSFKIYTKTGEGSEAEKAPDVPGGAVYTFAYAEYISKADIVFAEAYRNYSSSVRFEYGSSSYWYWLFAVSGTAEGETAGSASAKYADMRAVITPHLLLYRAQLALPGVYSAAHISTDGLSITFILDGEDFGWTFNPPAYSAMAGDGGNSYYCVPHGAELKIAVESLHGYYGLRHITYNGAEYYPDADGAVRLTVPRVTEDVYATLSGFWVECGVPVELWLDDGVTRTRITDTSEWADYLVVGDGSNIGNNFFGERDMLDGPYGSFITARAVARNAYYISELKVGGSALGEAYRAGKFFTVEFLPGNSVEVTVKPGEQYVLRVISTGADGKLDYLGGGLVTASAAGHDTGALMEIGGTMTFTFNVPSGYKITSAAAASAGKQTRVYRLGDAGAADVANIVNNGITLTDIDGDWYVTVMLAKNTVTDIRAPQDFIGIANDPAGHYVLRNDLDMTGFPVPAMDDSFTGVLDGGGHTVSGLTIVCSGGRRALFYEGCGAIVQNITVDGVRGVWGAASTEWINEGDPCQLEGVFFRYLTDGHFRNVTVREAALEASASIASSYIRGTVENTHFIGNLTSDGGCGGLIYQAVQVYWITGCSVKGTITCSPAEGYHYYVGGLIAACILYGETNSGAGSALDAYIEGFVAGCRTEADIIITLSAAPEYGWSYAGGMFASLLSRLAAGAGVFGCEARGSITVTHAGGAYICAAGGFAGIAAARIENCAAYADVTLNGKNDARAGAFAGHTHGYSAEFTDCLAAGDVTLAGLSEPSLNIYAGGFIGDAGSFAAFENCLYTGAVGVNGTGGAVEIGGFGLFLGGGSGAGVNGACAAFGTAAAGTGVSAAYGENTAAVSAGSLAAAIAAATAGWDGAVWNLPGGSVLPTLK